MSHPIAPGLVVPDTPETRTYSAALYLLADQIEAEGVMTIEPETIRQAAQRLDEQTVCINFLKRLPDGWKLVDIGLLRSVLRTNGLRVSGATAESIDAEVERVISAMLSAAPAEPAAHDDAELLDWLLSHPDAAICNDGAYGPYFVWFRYSNRTAPNAPTKRAAIVAAMQEGGAL